MPAILFITGNKRKVWQATDILSKHHISVDALDLPVVQVQHADPRLIAVEKAKSAYQLAKKPLVINDHAWAFPALKGFPGGYMKDMNNWLESEDFLALMANKQDRTVLLTERVVYTDGQITEIFEAVFPGKVINGPRGIGNVSCERIVVFDGSNKTIAEHIDSGEHARNMDESAWTKFGEWFISTQANT